MTPAPVRALSASAALIVLVAIPLVSTPPTDDKPAPVKGSLTIDLAGDDGASRPYMIRTAGPAPEPVDKVTLRDASGKHTASVTPAATDCTTTPARVAFPDQTAADWCLQLTNAAAGAELSGTVKAGANELALTVRRRDAFGSGPVAVLIAGLLCGLLVVLVPRWLRTAVRQIVLNRMLAANTKAVDTPSHIAGLTDWAKGRRLKGDTRETLIADVNRLVTSAPQLAAAARKRLTEKIQGATDVATSPLLSGARAIVNETTNDIGDFFVGSEEREQHPADDWSAAIDLLSGYRAELNSQRTALQSIARDLRKKPQAAHDVAERRFKEISTPDEVATLTPRLDELRLAIDVGLVETENQRRVQQRRSLAEGQPPAPAVLQIRRSAIDTIIPLGLSAGTLTGWALIAKAATALLLTIVMVYAFITIKQAGYDAKPLFHADGDYLTLFSTALGSGAAATVIALVGAWRPAPTEGEGD